VPFILEHGQIVGRLVYEKMIARPDKLYGSGIGSNYQAQSLKLSKHFNGRQSLGEPRYSAAIGCISVIILGVLTTRLRPLRLAS
jgi:hypothetical protein